MEACREEERRGGEEEEEEVENNGVRSPCSCPRFVYKAVEAIFKCLGLDSSASSSSEEQDPRTDTGEERGVIPMIARLVRRRPKPRVSTGPPGQVN